MADFSITGEVRLNSDPAEKSTSKWTIAAGQMIADFAKQASSKLAEVVKSGVDYNATMESYLTNFKVMLGSEEAAATKLSEIRKMAASTPFSLDDLTSGTQTLLQFGIAAGALVPLPGAVRGPAGRYPHGKDHELAHHGPVRVRGQYACPLCRPAGALCPAC